MVLRFEFVRRWSIAALCIAVLSWCSAAGGSFIVIDGFDDGGRTNGADPLDIAWYRAVNIGSLDAFFDSGAMNSNVLRFTPSLTFVAAVGVLPTTVSLDNVGDYIELSFDFRYLSTPGNQGSGLRWGIYNDAGTPATADDTSSADPNNVAYNHASKNDFGYYFNLSTGTGTTSHQLWRESGGTSSITAGTDRVQIGATEATLPKVTDTAVHSGFLRISRTAAGVNLKAGIDNTTYFDQESTGTIYTSFNGIAFGNAGNNQTVYFDNVRVEAVPEPGALIPTLIALAGLVFYAAGRKAR